MNVTPRTKTAPMAFTRREFWRGVRASWCIFMIELTAVLIGMGIVQSGLPWGPPLSMVTLYLVVGLPVGGAVSAVVAALSSPLAWYLGRRLATTRTIAVHLAAFALLGALIGTVLIGTIALLSGAAATRYVFGWPFSGVVVGVCVAAVVGGWAWTAWRSHRESTRITGV